MVLFPDICYLVRGLSLNQRELDYLSELPGAWVVERKGSEKSDLR